MSSIYRKARDKMTPSPSLKRENSKQGSSSDSKKKESMANSDTHSSSSAGGNSIRQSLTRSLSSRLSRKSKKPRPKSMVETSSTPPPKESHRPQSMLVESNPPLASPVVEQSNSFVQTSTLPTAPAPEHAPQPNASTDTIDKSEYEPIQPEPAKAEPAKTEPTETTSLLSKSPAGLSNLPVQSKLRSNSVSTLPIRSGSILQPVPASPQQYYPAAPSELDPLISPRGSVTSQEVVVPAEASWSIILLFTKIFEYCYYRNPRTSFVVLVLLVAAFVVFYLTYTHADTLVMQALEVDFQSISVLDLNSDGINFHVVGSVFVHYDNISNLFYRHVIKMAALVLGGVSFVPNDSVRIYASPKEIFLPRQHIVDIFPPEININTADRSISEIDFISKTQLYDTAVVALFNDINELANYKQQLAIEVQGVLNGNIKSKFFNYNTQDLNVFLDYKVNSSDIVPDVSIEDLVVTEHSDRVGYDVSTKIRIDSELPLNFMLNSIQWDVSFMDCDKNLVKLGDWMTNSIAFEPNAPINIKVNGEINDIPLDFLIVCDGGKTALNQLLISIISLNALEFHLNANEGAHNQEKLPKWLYNILKDVNYLLHFKLLETSPNHLFRYVNGYTVSDLSIVIPYGEKLHATVEGNTTVSVHIPPNTLDVDLGTTKFLSSVDIFDGDGHLALMLSSETLNEVSVSKGIQELQFNLKGLKAQMYDPVVSGQLANAILNSREVPQLFADLDLDQVSIDMSLLKTTLYGLDLHNITLPKQFQSKSGRDMIDYILLNLDINITSIFYESSTKEELNLAVVVEYFNPTNVTIEISTETIELGIAYNDTGIGQVTVSDLFIPKGNSEVTVNVRLHLADNVDKLQLETLVSQFISGYQQMEVDINGVGTSHNQQLDKFVKQLSVPRLALPRLGFGKSLDERHSPFLLGATIHILSSELEITVYNPLTNAEIMVEIQQGEAKHRGEILGHLTGAEILMVPPGVYTTPRIPIQISSGIGTDILRKAVNGQLDVEITAVFNVRLDKYELQLFYQGRGLKSDIKL